MYCLFLFVSLLFNLTVIVHNAVFDENYLGISLNPKNKLNQTIKRVKAPYGNIEHPISDKVIDTKIINKGDDNFLCEYPLCANNNNYHKIKVENEENRITSTNDMQCNNTAPTDDKTSTEAINVLFSLITEKNKGRNVMPNLEFINPNKLKSNSRINELNLGLELRTSRLITSLNASPNGSEDIAEFAYLDAKQIIEKYGYPVEEYSVITEDGYVLVMQRIPHGKGRKANNNMPPVFLLHGLYDSSDTYIIGNPDPAYCLAFMLADSGYDVWLGNTRGNKYSRHHTTLDPNKPEFWRFSYHELGAYDLPASLDFMLNVTGQDFFYYIGHSQGTTAFYVMCIMHPSYNDKVRLMISLAPVAWTTNALSLLFSTIALPLSTPGAAEKLETFGFYEVLPNSTLFTDEVEILCAKQSPIQEVCSNIVFQLFGYDSEMLNYTRLPLYLSHTPAGGSIRQIIHFCQQKYAGKFRQYDHGFAENLKIYGFIEPPDYDYTKITAPIALIQGENDYLARPVDVQKIKDNFPNIVDECLVPYKYFSHADFVWAIKAKTLVYDKVLELLSSY